MPAKHFLEKHQLLLICATLVLLVAAAFEPVRHNEFVNYDDTDYITENPHIQSGVTYESVIWAFTSGYASNWHPLTWLSHMLDTELFGLNPPGHHLHNLLLHIAGTILLFLVLQSMTGAIWRSAFVAAAFGLHPTHVESVAWAAERKDVLCTLFWMLTMAAYLGYARRGGLFRYLLVILCFAIGLMAKPMLVTLPIVLLILDFWPLSRIQKSPAPKRRAKSLNPYRVTSVPRLVMEKIPIFILALVSCVITYMVQQKGAVIKLDLLPLAYRILNAPMGYVGYLYKMAWPVNMAILYPYPLYGWPLWKPVVCFVVLALASGFSIFNVKKRSYLFTGWFWYGVTLIPVIGLVQVGVQSMADRYMYLPSVGIFIMVSWAAAELSAKWRYRKIILGTLSGVIIIAMIAGTRIQVTYWKDSLTLFEHTLAVTKDNYIIHNNMGAILLQHGRIDEAGDQFARSLQIHPAYSDAYNNMACILISRKQYDQASDYLQKTLKINPDYAFAHYNMGLVYEAQGKFDDALHSYEQAMRLKPDDFRPFKNAGVIKARQGLLSEAENYFRQSIQINPSDYKMWFTLGSCLGTEGKLQEAVDVYRQVLKLKPDFIPALNNLAWILATSPDDGIRNPSEAVQLAVKACELTSYKNPNLLDTLAASYARSGQFEKAVETAQKAISLAQAANDTKSVQKISEKLRLYQAGQAYIEPSPENQKPDHPTAAP